MKLSKRIKNPLLSIETILENSMLVAVGGESEQVIISRRDTLRMIEWLKGLRDRELETLALIEDALQ